MYNHFEQYQPRTIFKDRFELCPGPDQGLLQIGQTHKFGADLETFV